MSVCNTDGFFEKNAQNAYIFNNLTAKPAADGSVTIDFGGDPGATNHLPIVPGWNHLLRMCRARAQVLDGTCTLPGAQPVK